MRSLTVSALRRAGAGGSAAPEVSVECGSFGRKVHMHGRGPSAADLDRLLGCAHGHLTRRECGHRSLAVARRDAVGSHPRRTPRQQPCRVDLGDEIDERERDTLVIDDRAPEGFPAVGVLGGGPLEDDEQRASRPPARYRRNPRTAPP